MNPSSIDMKRFRRIRDRFLMELTRQDRASILSFFHMTDYSTARGLNDSQQSRLFWILLNKPLWSDRVILKVDSLADSQLSRIYPKK